MISVIISAFNEEASIRNTIAYVYAHASYKRLLKEVIVVDGGSTDNTIHEIEKTGATLVVCPRKGRTAQLNYGALYASGKILYFLNGHSLPSPNFISEIVKASTKGFACGTFSLKFDYKHWLLTALSWCTNHPKPWIHVSDQSLFMSKELFDKSGGFREDHVVMANQEMIKRLKRYSNFIVLKDNIIISAARYLRAGIIRRPLVQAVVYVLHGLGYHPMSLARLYRKYLRWDIGQRVERKRKKPLAKKTVKVEKEFSVSPQG